MPHTKSAKKRLRQNTVRRLHNRGIRADLRTQVKKLLRAVKDEDVSRAQEELRLVYKKLDKCAMRRYVHPNAADRYKARLTSRVNALASSKA